MFRLGGGLLILVSVNIIMGSLGALFTKGFKWRYFLQGIAKGAIVAMCFVATYFVGYLNPDIIAINVGGVDMNVLSAVQLVALAGYYHYAKQVIEKLSAMLGSSNDTMERKHSGKAKQSSSSNKKMPFE